eukprot:gene5297-6142_t
MGGMFSKGYLPELPRGSLIKLGIIGLENSGKTTLLNKFIDSSSKKLIESIFISLGVHIESIMYKGWDVFTGDLLYPHYIRKSFKPYLRSCDVIIFVVDSSDYLQIAAAKEQIDLLIRENCIDSSVFLVLANKQDLKKRIAPAQLENYLELYRLNVPWKSIVFDSLGSKGPIHLSTSFTDKLIPNASGKIFIGLFLVKEEHRSELLGEQPLVHTQLDHVNQIGVLAQISSTSLGYHYFEVKQRIQIVDRSSSLDTFFKIEAYSTDIKDSPEDIAEQITGINHMVRDFLTKYPDSYRINFSIDFTKHIEPITDPEVFISSIINFYGLNYPKQCQEILETPSVLQRLKMVRKMLEEEEVLLQEQKKIYVELEEEKKTSQKKLFLNEQLKSIKKQLGVEFDEKEQIVQKYNTRLAKLKLPDTVKKVIEDEIVSGILFQISREIENYLDWLTNLPWEVYSPELFDLKHSKEVLDKEHYGLTDIKQRILEFISVGHIKGSVQGKIICFVGPPGTGKTSIGKSIADCLKRKFFRFSVGGLFDEGEIKGHRRTYIGSMPGKLIQCMKLVQCSNPVILIDEIDKIGKRNLGDPSSALLEVLDPEQNSSFIDHYLDVPYDLSRVLFICTANSDQTIPGPLFDRMEVIYLSGYVEEEQIQIVRNFIIPRTLKACGISTEQLTISDDVVKMLVKFYSREVGVRELERLVEKIMRKSALEIVNGATSLSITSDNIQEYLGIPAFSSDRYYTVTPIGVVNGLAWSQRGGSTLYIETIAEPSTSPRLRTTGKLGDVMAESTNIAYTYAKNFLYSIDPSNTFFETHSLHMHAPQGSIPKDGPSAGVTMVTSLLSLALKEPVLNDLGMTGEITITGKVFTIGGVKEKTIAAKRSGLTKIVVPANNKIDYEELPEYIKQGITVQFASEGIDVNSIGCISNVGKDAQCCNKANRLECYYVQGCDLFYELNEDDMGYFVVVEDELEGKGDKDILILPNINDVTFVN